MSTKTKHVMRLPRTQEYLTQVYRKNTCFILISLIWKIVLVVSLLSYYDTNEDKTLILLGAKTVFEWSNDEDLRRKKKRWRYFQLPIIKSFSFSLLESDKFLGVVTWLSWTNQEKTQSRHDIQLLLTDNVIEYTKEESWSVFCCSRGPKNI